MIDWSPPTRRGHRVPPTRALVAALVALIVAAGAVGAAYAVKFSTAPSAGSPSRPQPRTATLGLMAPLSGDLASLGGAVRNAVRLAVDEANADAAIPGWKIRLSLQDDLSRPDGGARAAGELAADETVIGVVGPLSSTVAMVAVPTLSAAGIAVVSPSNSRPELTGLADATAATSATARSRPYPGYFRLSGTDVLAAWTSAEYAVTTMGRRRITVVDGGPGFGTSLAQRFASDARQLGATVTGIHKVHGSLDDESEVASVVERVRAEAPDLLYVATGFAFAAQLRTELAGQGLAVAVLGSDGLGDPRYPEQAEGAAEGDTVVDLGAPLSELPRAGSFAAAYLHRWGGRGNRDAGTRIADPAVSATSRALGSGSGLGSEAGPPAVIRGDGSAVTGDPGLAVPPPTAAADVIPSVAAYAYDAAGVLLRAASSVLPGRPGVNGAARAAVIAALRQGRFVGATGEVGFDAWGDAVAPLVTIYAVRNRAFVVLRVRRP
ncbi:branched-chain amino acid ABC transporter substrate-binding protein [Frankia sp. Cj5]|uniref:branched-chain amino acid ABC transporter substrate-binding protein n=1 Tax=Frankia sp. Cj5 TaxID=2880978 RepID=UPI001EF6FC9B|nr:branched-chain amino acid ABC transporter substrate-binding protein [Frankia sp. Cj5]